MPTYKENLHLGTKDPVIGGDDLAEGIIGTLHLEDGAVTTPKIANGAVTWDKLSTYVQRLILSASGMGDTVKEVFVFAGSYTDYPEDAVEGLRIYLTPTQKFYVRTDGEWVEDDPLSEALYVNSADGLLYRWTDGGLVSISSVNIVSMDDLDTLTDASLSRDPRRVFYAVTCPMKGGAVVDGVLLLFSDNLAHSNTQVLVTHRVLDSDGSISEAHNDNAVSVYWRSYGLSTHPTHPDTWTKWQYLVPDYNLLDGRFVSIETILSGLRSRLDTDYSLSDIVKLIEDVSVDVSSGKPGVAHFGGIVEYAATVSEVYSGSDGEVVYCSSQNIFMLRRKLENGNYVYYAQWVGSGPYFDETKTSPRTDVVYAMAGEAGSGELLYLYDPSLRQLVAVNTGGSAISELSDSLSELREEYDLDKASTDTRMSAVESVLTATESRLERVEHVKEKSVGLFSTLASLESTYPMPEVGDWALVGESSPFDVYECMTNGLWSTSGGTYDAGEIDLSDYVTKEEFDATYRGTQTYIDVLSLAVSQSGIIDPETGGRKTNANYRILTIPNDGYDGVKFTTAVFTGTIVMALYTTDTISADGYMSDYTIKGTGYSYSTYESEIPSTCKLIAIVYGTAYADQGVTLFQALVRRGGIPDINRDIAELQSDVDDINGEMDDVREEVQDAVQGNFLTELVTKQSGFIGRPADLTLTGFWTDGENGAELSTAYAYHSMPLIAVQPGQLVEMTDWCISPISASIAMCMFDADKMPYNGTKSRIDFYQFTTKDYATGHYAYRLPDNVYWLGISVKDSDTFGDNPKVTVGETGYTLTEEGVDLVRSAGGGGGDTSAASKDNSALYYLKGTGADPSVVSTKKVCILAAGQSNIDGRNPHSELPSYVVTPNANIRYSKNNVNGTFVDFSVPTTDNGIDWAFDTIVYNALVDANHGGLDKIYVIKRSMGGTSIDPEGATDYHWTADYEQLDSESHSLLRLFERGIRAAIARDGEDFDIKAVLWHQGEGDDNTSQAVADRYQNNLRNVVAYIRGIVGKPNLPFICGSISENNTERWRADINQAIWNIAAEDDNFYCVDMSGAALKDAWHFNSASSEYFGQKAYDILVDIGVVSGTKYNPTCPWEEKTTEATTFNNVSGESVAKAMQMALKASSTSIDQTARDMASAAQTAATNAVQTATSAQASCTDAYSLASAANTTANAAQATASAALPSSKVWVGTQAEYDALPSATKSNIIAFIKE